MTIKTLTILALAGLIGPTLAMAQSSPATAPAAQTETSATPPSQPMANDPAPSAAISAPAGPSDTVAPTSTTPVPDALSKAQEAYKAALKTHDKAQIAKASAELRALNGKTAN